MREQIDAARTLRTVLATRKLPGADARQVDNPKGDFAHLGFGTDWGSIAGAWLTEWERTRDPKMRDRLVASMKSIAAQPKGFFTGGERMNLVTGAFDISKDPKVDVSHLSAAFGLPEVCAELIELLNIPEFERAWLLYCELYNGTDEQQKAALGESFGSINLQQGHARLTAYAANRKKDADSRGTRLEGTHRRTQRLRRAAAVQVHRDRVAGGAEPGRRGARRLDELHGAMGACCHRVPGVRAQDLNDRKAPLSKTGELTPRPVRLRMTPVTFGMTPVAKITGRLNDDDNNRDEGKSMKNLAAAARLGVLVLFTTCLLTGCKKADAPVFSPAPGTYTGTQYVAISSQTFGATIIYTTDGSAPSCVKEHGTIYSDPVAIDASVTLKAMACALLRAESLITTGVYTIKPPETVATPEFSPAAGTYITTQSVSITSATADATIRYTSDGIPASCASGTEYSGPIEVSQSTSLSAIGCAAGKIDSAVANATYVITPPAAAPVFDPAAGAYTSVQSVTLTSATPAATFRYTTDGSEPSCSTGQNYGGAIAIANSLTLKAVPAPPASPTAS